MKLKYLEEFYSGNNPENFSLLNSDILNKKIYKINDNFKKIENILNIFSSYIKNENEFYAENISSKKIINNDYFFSNIGEFNKIKTENLNSINMNIKNSNFEEIIVKKINAKNLYYDNCLGKNLSIDNLKINKNFELYNSYSLNENGIEFFTNISYPLIFNYNKNNTGILFKNNEKISKIAIENDDLNIENSFGNINFSALKVNFSNINTNYFYSNEIGSEKERIKKIFAEDIYGHYYSYDKADIAELYESDEFYEPGTIVEVGEKTEITIAKGFKPIIGVISDTYGYLLNKELEEKVKIALPVALTGRVKIKLSKKGKRGDYIVPDITNYGFGYPIKHFTRNAIGILINPEENIIKLI